MKEDVKYDAVRNDPTKALLGGEVVDYAQVYEVPGRGGMGYRRGGYEGVPQEEEGV